MNKKNTLNSIKKVSEIDVNLTNLTNQVDTLVTEVDEIKNNGTTTEAINLAVQTEIQNKIDSGEMANLTAKEGSLSLSKLEFTDDKNLASTLQFTTGIQINASTGAEASGYQAHHTTDYLELKPNVTYVLADNSFNYNGGWFFRGAYYDANKNFTSGFSSANNVVCNGTTKKFVRFTCDKRNISVDQPATFFFGDKNDLLVRKEKGMLHLPTVNANYYKGGIEATSLSESAYVPEVIKKDLVSNKNLENSLLNFNCKNLLDISKAQEKKLLNADGSIGNTNSNTGVVDVEHIEGNGTYYIKTGTYDINTAWWLDEFKNPISKVSIVSGTYVYQAPSNAKYLRCLTNYSNLSGGLYTSKIYVNKGNTDLGYVAYADDYKINTTYLPGAKGNKSWEMYKYRAIGDSRTAGYNNNVKDDQGNWIWDLDVAVNYPGFIKYYTGIQMENKAVAGASFCTRTTVTDIPTMFEQALNLPSDTDIVTIFGMSNDRIIGVHSEALNPENERDNSQDKYDVTTFKGAIRQTIKNIKTQAPYCTIIFLVEDCEPAVDGGQTKKDMIEEICREHKIPTLNLSECAMTGRASDEYMEQKYHCYTDSLHESVYGQKMEARAIAGEMAKYLW